MRSASVIARTPRSSTREPGLARRLVSGVFGTNAGVLITIPGMVLVMGAVFVVMGQQSLQTSIDASLRARMADLTTAASHSVESWLASAEPMTQRLVTQVRSGDPAEGLRVLADGLMVGRRVMTHIGVTAPDGSEATLSRFSETDVRFARSGPAPLPPWYAPAVAAGGLTWVIAERGAVCEMIAVQAVRDPAGTVLGVVHVHADPAVIESRVRTLVNGVALPPPPDAVGIDALSPRQLPGGAADLPASDVDIIFCTADGRLLAAAANDGIRLKVLAAIGPWLSHVPRTVFCPAQIDGTAAFIGASRVVLPGAPQWYAVIHLRPDSLLAPALAHLHRTLVLALAVLALAVLVALGLASHLARQRRIASRARAQARAAKERLRSLGSYRLIRKLGEGGMGTVWLAEHEMLARPAAVKLIQVETLATTREAQERICARFAHEARVTAALHSRNTVTLYDYGMAADGSFYYAMELLDGMDLERLVRRHGPQRPGRVVAILEQACRSLIEAHAAGMVHRDIKPANLFLCRLSPELDLIKVLDFGLVSDTETEGAQLYAKGMVQGTPAFMAPEQASAQKVDGRADLYALGCVGWWLLTGHEVFAAETATAMMVAHVSQPVPPLPMAAPPGLAALLAALLRKNPDSRPRSALEVLDALTAISCPVEQAWTFTDAQAWWEANCPAVTEAAEPVQSISQSLLMPARSGLFDPLSGIAVVYASTPDSDEIETETA